MVLATLTKSLPEYTKAKLDYHGLNKYFEDRIAVTPVTSKSKSAEASELIEKIGLETINQAYFIGDRTEDVLVEKEINRDYELKTSGVYVNRLEKPIPQEITTYHSIKSLEELPKIIGV